MKKIIKYLTDLKVQAYMFFGGQIFIYILIAYINNIDNIKISMLIQMLISSFVMSLASTCIFDSNIENDIMKVIINYVALLLITLFFVINFSWLKLMNISVMNYFVIYTISYIIMTMSYTMYLKIMKESYTESLNIYKKRKRRD